MVSNLSDVSENVQSIVFYESSDGAKIAVMEQKLLLVFGFRIRFDLAVDTRTRGIENWPTVENVEEILSLES